MTLHYTVSPARPDAHVYEVTLRVEGAVAEGEHLCVARWIPGSYMLRNFARSILRMTARSAGRDVALTKLDTSTWLLPAASDGLDIQLEVHAHEASVRAAWLDRQRGFFNGTSLFPCLPSRVSDPVQLTISPPTHEQGAAWRVATTLPVVDVDASGFGLYQAQDWDELIDHPVEMGCLDEVCFDACGVPHAMVLAGGGRFDDARLIEDLTLICEHHIRFFGEPAPVDQYLFQVALMESGYGGLEHRASTALMATRQSLPSPGAGDTRSDDYVTFLGLCSHEYFHTWNVKRIKPARFMPFDLDREAPTRLLWFFEGVTSYYDDLALVRCGVIDSKKYLELLSKTITRVQRGSGRHVQSVTDSSLDAWTKFYMQDENAANAIVSYYAKGALVALCLDAWIRDASGGTRSLDDLMRALWKRWQDTGAGLAEKEPEQQVAELAGDAIAQRLSDVLDATGDLPLEEALALLGVSLTWRARVGRSDTGGSAKPGATAGPWFGAAVKSTDGGLRLLQVSNGSPAERAGLAPGDVLIAVEQYRVTDDSLDDLLARHATSDSVQVHLFRNGRLESATLPIGLAPSDTAQLDVTDPTRLEQWLGTASS